MLSPILKLGLPSSVFPDQILPLRYTQLSVWVTLHVVKLTVSRYHERWKYLQHNTHELWTDEASVSLPLQGAWEQVSYVAMCCCLYYRVAKAPEQRHHKEP